MKKTMLALAVLGAFAGVAQAQSSVTLFGVVDMNARNVRNSGGSVQSLSTDGYNSSRLGFRGVEDLGGGLQGGFWLEAGMANDVGAVGGGAGAAGTTFFNRRSTVSLIGRFGEVRLGRDYTPQFWNTTLFDVFGTNGLGSSLNVQNVANPLGTGATTFVRANNTIGYFLPSGLGGLYGQAQVSAGEGVHIGNKHWSARLGWAAGPLNIAAAMGRTDIVGGKYLMTNLGASYDLGVAKIMGYVTNDKNDINDRKQQNVNLGVSVPMGQAELRASVNRSNQKNAGFDSVDATQLAVGFVYNLSKRTALYGTYSTISNKAGANYTVNGSYGAASSSGTAQTLDDSSKGFEFGVRHAF